MDHFGIGQAMQAMAHVYAQSARRTGRTTSLLESLKDGDRVVFVTAQEADRVRRLCNDRGLKVDCIVLPVDRPDRLFERGTPKGRTLFDHSWVERYYIQSMERCQKEIDHWQRESSGFGAAHLETQYQAEQLAKWRI
jgi:hypothetical protein